MDIEKFEKEKITPYLENFIINYDPPKDVKWSSNWHFQEMTFDTDDEYDDFVKLADDDLHFDLITDDDTQMAILSTTIIHQDRQNLTVICNSSYGEAISMKSSEYLNYAIKHELYKSEAEKIIMVMKTEVNQ